MSNIFKYLDKFLPDFIYAPLQLIDYSNCAFLPADTCHPKDDLLSLYPDDDVCHDADVRPDDANQPNDRCSDVQPHLGYPVWTCSSVRAYQSYDIWGLASGVSGLTFRYEINLLIASLIVPYYDPNLARDLCYNDQCDQQLQCTMYHLTQDWCVTFSLMCNVYHGLPSTLTDPTHVWKLTNDNCGVDFSSVQACYSYDIVVVSHSACLDSYTGTQINKTNICCVANCKPFHDHLILTFDAHDDLLHHAVQSVLVLDVSEPSALKSNQIRTKIKFNFLGGRRNLCQTMDGNNIL